MSGPQSTAHWDGWREVALHQIGWPGSFITWRGGLELLAPDSAFEAHITHQALHRAAGHLYLLHGSADAIPCARHRH
jgi:hypothetical protein